jgi:RNA polymerase sigma-70 factor (ECF subfamily)
MCSPASRSGLVLERSRLEVERLPERFEDFYMKEYSAVVGLAYALSGSRSGAEDLAQEAFLAAYSDWHRISGYEQPGAWVRRVVANRSVSSFRRRSAEAKALALAALGQRTQIPDLGSSDPDFWNAVRSLPRRQSQVVALFYLEDLPIATVATILHVSPGTVKRHLHDGRLSLGRRLAIEEEEDEA